jgi:hypothetical protein
MNRNIRNGGKIKSRLGRTVLIRPLRFNIQWDRTFPFQAWAGPEGSKKLRFPDFLTTAEDGGKFVSFTHRPHLPQGNTPRTHFCSRLSLYQGYRAIRRIYVNEKFHDTNWDLTNDLLSNTRRKLNI